MPVSKWKAPTLCMVMLLSILKQFSKQLLWLEESNCLPFNAEENFLGIMKIFIIKRYSFKFLSRNNNEDIKFEMILNLLG